MIRALFIGGCGRSGTTMLGDLLGVPRAHACTPETSFKLGLVEHWNWSGDAARRDDALAWLAAHRKFRELGVSLDDLPARARGGELRDLLDEIVSAYARGVDRPGADVWIDHTPTNVLMGVALLDAYPDARIVHLVRDGRAIAASVIPLDWGPNDVLSAARFWIDFVVHGIALETAHPDRVLRVRYEDLVREPERHLRAVCAFAGLAYDPAMLDGGGLKLPAANADQHALVGKRPDPSRLDAWRSKLEPREVEMFEAAVGDLLPLLGYERLHGPSPRRASSFVELYYSVRDRAVQSPLNRWRKRKRKLAGGFRPRA